MNFARPEWLHLLWIALALLTLRLMLFGRVTRPTSTWIVWRDVLEGGAGRGRRRRRLRLRTEPWLEFLLLAATIGLLAAPRRERASVTAIAVVDVGAAASVSSRVQQAEAAIAEAKRRWGRGVDVEIIRRVVDDPKAVIARERRAGRPMLLVADHVDDAELADDVDVVILDAPVSNVGITAAEAIRMGETWRLFVGVVASRWFVAPDVNVTVTQGARSWRDKIAMGDERGRERQHGWERDLPLVVDEAVTVTIDADDTVDVIESDDVVVLDPPRSGGEVVVDDDLVAFQDAFVAAGYDVVLARRGVVVKDAELRVGRAPLRDEDNVANASPTTTPTIVVDPPDGEDIVIPDATASLVPSGPTADLPWSGLRPATFRAFVVERAGEKKDAKDEVWLTVDEQAAIVHRPSTRRVTIGFDPKTWSWDAHPSFPLFLAVAAKAAGLRPENARERFASSVPFPTLPEVAASTSPQARRVSTSGAGDEATTSATTPRRLDWIFAVIALAAWSGLIVVRRGLAGRDA